MSESYQKHNSNNWPHICPKCMFNANFFSDTFEIKNIAKYEAFPFIFTPAIFHEICVVYFTLSPLSNKIDLITPSYILVGVHKKTL